MKSVRMADLSLEVIEKEHAHDAKMYRNKRPSVQHAHRHWLLNYIKKHQLGKSQEDS